MIANIVLFAFVNHDLAEHFDPKMGKAISLNRNTEKSWSEPAGLA